MHAIVINVVLGAFFMIVMLAFGRPIYRLLGGEGGELEAALTYSNIIFAGNIAALGDERRSPASFAAPATCWCPRSWSASACVLLLPLSPMLIFGIGPFPALGIAGGGAAVLLFYVAGTAFFVWYIASGRNVARLRWSRLRWPLFSDILQDRRRRRRSPRCRPTSSIALATALVANTAGASAMAGYGTAARLEYLLIPLVFGLGAPLVALVGTNIGAGQRQRALRIALIGGAHRLRADRGDRRRRGDLAGRHGCGCSAAIRRSSTPAALYLRMVGPFYGFFGLGLALYFASQGAGRLFWPLIGGFLRTFVAIGRRLGRRSSSPDRCCGCSPRWRWAW